MSDEQLYQRVDEILEQTRGQVARTVNTTMVLAYWHIGRELMAGHEAEPRVQSDEVVKDLAKRLQRVYGSGFNLASVCRMRKFYLAFPHGSSIRDSAAPSQSRPRMNAARPADLPGTHRPTPPPTIHFPSTLAWSHYLVLLRVPSDQARAFYEIEAAREGWSVRQLERQIAAHLFERLAKHRNPHEVIALARQNKEIATAADVLQDPLVAEFLDVGRRAVSTEPDLERAIIARIETFLLELGRGFCFVARRKPQTTERATFDVDLVFYNRHLPGFVLLDLKLGALTTQDLEEMALSSAYFDRTQRGEYDVRTIGIVMCSEANAAMVKILVPEGSDPIMAATFTRYLPSEAELLAQLAREREEIQRALGPIAPATPPPDFDADAVEH